LAIRREEMPAESVTEEAFATLIMNLKFVAEAPEEEKRASRQALKDAIAIAENLGQKCTRLEQQYIASISPRMPPDMSQGLAYQKLHLAVLDAITQDKITDRLKEAAALITDMRRSDA
jgi:hypothetical protein